MCSCPRISANITGVSPKTVAASGLTLSLLSNKPTTSAAALSTAQYKGDRCHSRPRGTRQYYCHYRAGICQLCLSRADNAQSRHVLSVMQTSEVSFRSHQRDQPLCPGRLAAAALRCGLRIVHSKIAVSSQSHQHSSRTYQATRVDISNLYATHSCSPRKRSSTGIVLTVQVNRLIVRCCQQSGNGSQISHLGCM